jgi:hypothetical protein
MYELVHFSTKGSSTFKCAESETNMAKHRSEVDASAELAKALKAGNATALAALSASAGKVESSGATMTKLACNAVAYGNLLIKNPKLKFNDCVWGPFADNYFGDDKMDKRRMLDKKPKTAAEIAAKEKAHAHFINCGKHAAWPLKDRERVGAAIIGAYALNAGGLTVKAALLGTVLENHAETAPDAKTLAGIIDERAGRKSETEFDVRTGLKRMASTCASWFADDKSAKAFWASFSAVHTEGKNKGQPLLSPKAQAMTVALIGQLKEIGLAVSASKELRTAFDKATVSLNANAKTYAKAVKDFTPRA